MAVDLTPRKPAKSYGGEGCAYYEWSAADLPMLGVASIGAAKLALAAGGLALPSYSDSAKRSRTFSRVGKEANDGEGNGSEQYETISSFTELLTGAICDDLKMEGFF